MSVLLSPLDDTSLLSRQVCLPLFRNISHVSSRRRQSASPPSKLHTARCALHPPTSTSSYSFQPAIHPSIHPASQPCQARPICLSVRPSWLSTWPPISEHGSTSRQSALASYSILYFAPDLVHLAIPLRLVSTRLVSSRLDLAWLCPLYVCARTTYGALLPNCCPRLLALPLDLTCWS